MDAYKLAARLDEKLHEAHAIAHDLAAALSPDPEIRATVECVPYSVGTSEPVVIRGARESDLPFITGQLAALAELEGLPMTATSRSLRGLLFFTNYVFASIACREAHGESELLGGAIWQLGMSTFQARPILLIEDLFVKQEARRTGVGSSLLRHLAQQGQSLNCCSMQWLRFRANHTARAFYRSHGAIEWPAWVCGTISGDAMEALANGN